MNGGPNACDCLTYPVLDKALENLVPAIDRNIRDNTILYKSFWFNQFPVKTMPFTGNSVFTKFRYSGAVGDQYQGMDTWYEEKSSTKQTDLQPGHDACGYKWNYITPPGYERINWNIFKKDLRTCDICLNDLLLKWEFRQFMDLLFRALPRISYDQIEQFVRNAIEDQAVKYVLGDRRYANPAEPRQWPNILGMIVQKPNLRTLTRFYNEIRMRAGMYGVNTEAGRPQYILVTSSQAMDDLYREDCESRQDLQFSGMADKLISDYGFVDSIRGQLIPFEDVYIWRYKTDALGNLIRVLPREDGIPLECGFKSDLNPEYESAPYEAMAIIGKDPFQLWARPPMQSAGGGTEFGQKASGFSWHWHNPPRYCDPERQVGYYYSRASIGKEPGDYTDWPMLLFSRRPEALDASFWGNPECPPEAIVCPPNAPNTTCPCPSVVSICEAVEDDRLLFTFSSDPGFAAGSELTLLLKNGGSVITTVETVNGNKYELVFPDGITPDLDASVYLGVLCTPITVCSTMPMGFTANLVAPLTIVDFNLSETLSCVAVGDLITAYFGDGTVQNIEVTAFNTANLVLSAQAVGGAEFTLSYGYVCQHQGVCRLCCVPTEANGCPACDLVFAVCEPST